MPMMCIRGDVMDIVRHKTLIILLGIKTGHPARRSKRLMHGSRREPTGPYLRVFRCVCFVVYHNSQPFIFVVINCDLFLHL